MSYTRKDLVQAKNLFSFLKKAKIELEGLEILAAADVFKWLANLTVQIETDVIEAENPKPVLESMLAAATVVEEQVIPLQKKTKIPLAKPAKAKKN